MPAPSSSPRAERNPRYERSTQKSGGGLSDGKLGGNTGDIAGEMLAAYKASLKKVAPRAPAAAPVVSEPAPIVPRQPDQPGQSSSTAAPIAPEVNPQLPSDKVTADRGDRRPDMSLLDALDQPTADRSGKKYKGTVLGSVYRLPTDPARAAQTLQQFNGPRGQRMSLGG